MVMKVVLSCEGEPRGEHKRARKGNAGFIIHGSKVRKSPNQKSPLANAKQVRQPNSISSDALNRAGVCTTGEGVVWW
jgi:hypothetical protein